MPSVAAIEIVSTPPGGAPGEIREAWVGCRLVGAVHHETLTGVTGVERNNPESFLYRHGGCWEVPVGTAIRALQGRKRKKGAPQEVIDRALEYWRKYERSHPPPLWRLVFRERDCKVVTG